MDFGEMKRISNIGSLLKRIYRSYSNDLLGSLQSCGFVDLRPSFLEVLIHICENEGVAIKEIGAGCGLKKQTMTSHLNELEKRGYIVRRMSPRDKRAQQIFLTEFGERFHLSLTECISNLEKGYIEKVGDVEMDRVELILKNFFQKISS